MVRADVSHISQKPLHDPAFHFTFQVLFHVLLRIDGWGPNPQKMGLESGFAF